MSEQQAASGGSSRRITADWLFDALLPVFATLLALAIGAVLLLLLGVNPLTAYGAMLRGAFGTVSGLTQTLSKATPLLLVALGICIAFRGGVINIGGEGQIILGAITTAAFALAFPTWPAWLLLPLALILGILAGALWGGIAGFLEGIMLTTRTPNAYVDCSPGQGWWVFRHAGKMAGSTPPEKLLFGADSSNIASGANYISEKMTEVGFGEHLDKIFYSNTRGIFEKVGAVAPAK